MADNNFRYDRGRDSPAWDDSRQAASDPLAELARLIGQADPYAEADRRGKHDSGRSHDVAPAPDADWAAEDSHAAHDRRADERYAPPAAASHQPYAPQEPGNEDDEPSGGGRYFSGPAAAFNGFRDETDVYHGDESSIALPARQSPALAAAEPYDSYESDQPDYHGEQSYAADDYYDETPTPRRRNGLLVIMAVLALTVVGTAGAFGYRAMFGGSVLPTLPPIIKAGNGPNKIMPAYGDSQANGSSQAGAANTGSTENLVSREEQPVNIEPPKATPRVVATIPIITGQGALPPGVGAPPAPALEASAQNPPGPVAAPPPPAPASVAAPVVAPAPPPASAEPKKIHTVTIKADQVGSVDAPAAALPAARAQVRPAPRPSAAASPPPSGSSAPLSIVPGGPGNAATSASPPPQRTRVATAPVAVASAGPVTGVHAAASSGGGYAVQITSQRTKAEAQASFRELRAKFPNQLGGHEAIIRRADLGAKGTFYRALVGPFASAEQAARLCNDLKAAGGTCIPQRN
jgi:hypothetical protein